jgi:hypothetical protein
MLGEIEWLYSRIVDRCPAMPTSEMGQTETFARSRSMSVLPPGADMPMNGRFAPLGVVLWPARPFPSEP